MRSLCLHLKCKIENVLKKLVGDFQSHIMCFPFGTTFESLFRNVISVLVKEHMFALIPLLSSMTRCCYCRYRRRRRQRFSFFFNSHFAATLSLPHKLSHQSAITISCNFLNEKYPADSCVTNAF